jgi:hypothetical protein
MEKRDHHVFEDVFHAVVEKAHLIAGKTKKLFKSPLRIIDASIISLCLATCDWAAYRKTKGAVKLHLTGAHLSVSALLPHHSYRDQVRGLSESVCSAGHRARIVSPHQICGLTLFRTSNRQQIRRQRLPPKQMAHILFR